jgi:uncharacterized protein YybS (DUF2232 family)
MYLSFVRLLFISLIIILQFHNFHQAVWQFRIKINAHTCLMLLIFQQAFSLIHLFPCLRFEEILFINPFQ